MTAPAAPIGAARDTGSVPGEVCHAPELVEVRRDHHWNRTHPWLAGVAVVAIGAVITGPVALGAQETVFRLLRASGMVESNLLPAYGASVSLVMGCTMLRIARAEDPLLQQKGPSHGFPAAQFPEVLALAPEIDAHVTSDGLRDWLARLLRTFRS